MKKCLLIAPVEAHATVGRIAAIASSGYELNLVDVSSNPLRFELNQYPFSLIKSYKYFGFDPKPKWQALYKILNKLRCIGWIRESQKNVDRLALEIKRVKPDIVVTYYGPIGIQYAKIIKIIDANLPVVSILNLIPSSLNYERSISGRLLKRFNDELNNYRRTIQSLDHLICASPEMMDYVSSKYGINLNKISVLPDYFPKSMTFNALESEDELPGANLIFLGAPERWGGALDDIDRQLFNLATSGVAIYSGRLDEYVMSTNNAFCYPFFSDEEVFSGKLSNYAHKFKAALITYGIDIRHQRFKTTLPTRFFSALSAGIPIVVRSGLFDAVETYVENYQIGFCFENLQDLKLKLLDDELMNRYRRNIAKHCKSYAAESQGIEFQNIFNLLLSK